MPYILKHDWNLNGSIGHFQMTFDDEKEARNQFDYYKSLIETDDYNFDVKFTAYHDGDNHFAAYEDLNFSENRQDLVLVQIKYPDNLLNL